MIRTALDSDNLNAFTDNTDFILTYTDLVKDPREFEGAHPHQIVRYIDRGLGDPGTKATIADVERFAMKPSDLPHWWDVRHAAGKQFLTVYCDRSTLAAVNTAANGRAFNHWVATLDGTMHIAGYKPFEWPALVQIADSRMTGLSADFSLVFSPGWNPSPESQAIVALRSKIAEARRVMASASSALTVESGNLASFA